jgi:hypothetical protein
MNLRAFLRQPTTVGGLAALSGTIAAALSGQMTWRAALPLVVGAIVSILLPDDSAASANAAALARAAEALASSLPPPSPKPPENSMEKP